MSNYEVKTVKQDPAAYRSLITRWWDWIYEDDCDEKSEMKDVTFLRDDIIGGPRSPNKKTVNEQEIHRKVGTNIFLPVYHVHICDADPHYEDGKPCKTIERCMETAENDLKKVYNMYADISTNGGELQPISKLEDHDITLVPFTLNVKRDHNLNREPKYHLKPGIYEGIARGTFILLENFQKGTYVLYFGGDAGTDTDNYYTHSKYTLYIE